MGAFGYSYQQIDSSNVRFNSAATKFGAVQAKGDTCFIQLDGSDMFGRLTLEESPDNSTWSKYKYRDGSSNYTQTVFVIDNSTYSSIRLDTVPFQWVRLSIDASYGGGLRNIKVVS